MWHSPYTAAGRNILVASNKNADDTVVNSCSIFWGLHKAAMEAGRSGVVEKGKIYSEVQAMLNGENEVPNRTGFWDAMFQSKETHGGDHLLSIYADISYKKKLRPDWSPSYFTSSDPHQRLHIRAFYLKYWNIKIL